MSKDTDRGSGTGHDGGAMTCRSTIARCVAFSRTLTTSLFTAVVFDPTATSRNKNVKPNEARLSFLAVMTTISATEAVWFTANCITIDAPTATVSLSSMRGVASTASNASACPPPTVTNGTGTKVRKRIATAAQDR